MSYCNNPCSSGMQNPCNGMGGFAPPMGGGMPMGMPMMPPSRPRPNKKPSCSGGVTGDKLSEVTGPLLELLGELKKYKKIKASVKGNDYDIQLLEGKNKSCPPNCPNQSANFKLCDCSIPIPPGLCGNTDSTKEQQLEETFNQNLSCLTKLMREMVASNASKPDDDDDTQTIEIPVMMVPPNAMGMMGGGMPPFGGGGMYGGYGGPPFPERDSPYGAKKDKIICKTDRDQQCDESSLKDAGKDKAGGKKGEGAKGKGKGNGKKGKKGKKK